MKSNKTQPLTDQQQFLRSHPPHEYSQLLIQELIASPFWDDLNAQAQQRWLNQLQDLVE